MISLDIIHELNLNYAINRTRASETDPKITNLSSAVFSTRENFDDFGLDLSRPLDM